MAIKFCSATSTNLFPGQIRRPIPNGETKRGLESTRSLFSEDGGSQRSGRYDSASVKLFFELPAIIVWARTTLPTGSSYLKNKHSAKMDLFIYCQASQKGEASLGDAQGANKEIKKPRPPRGETNF